MSKINGWHRLWLVISLIWCASLGAITWPEYSALVDERIAKFKVTDTESPSGESKTIRIAFSSSLSKEASHKDAIDNILPKLLEGKFSAVPELYKQPYIDTVSKQKPKLLARFAKQSLIPPAALLLLGWAVAWIISGFRKERQRT